MQAAGCKADNVAFLKAPFTRCRRPSSASCPLARELVDVFQEREWGLWTLNLKRCGTRRNESAVWGEGEEGKEGMPFKKLLYMVSGALWTWDNWYSNHAAKAFQCDRGTRKFLTRGFLLEKGAAYQTVTAQLKWLLYSYICERPRSVRPTYVPEPQFVMHNYLNRSGNYVYRIK